MTIDSLLQLISGFFNSSFGFMLTMVATMAGVFWLLARLDPFEDKWRKWEGSIITAIKLAEKQIPDDTPDAGLAKLDAALRFVLKAYAEANNGKEAPAKLVEQIKQGIQIKHADLDRFGGLSKP